MAEQPWVASQRNVKKTNKNVKRRQQMLQVKLSQHKGALQPSQEDCAVKGPGKMLRPPDAHGNQE